MNGRKAKQLRRFAARMGGFDSLPQIKYNVIEHVRTYRVPPVTKDEKRQCYLQGTKTLARTGKTYQVVMDNCVRRLYQFTKKKYGSMTW